MTGAAGVLRLGKWKAAVVMMMLVVVVGVLGIRVEQSCGGFTEILVGGIGVKELAVLVNFLSCFIAGEHDR